MGCQLFYCGNTSVFQHCQYYQRGSWKRYFLLFYKTYKCHNIEFKHTLRNLDLTDNKKSIIKTDESFHKKKILHKKISVYDNKFRNLTSAAFLDTRDMNLFNSLDENSRWC